MKTKKLLIYGGGALVVLIIVALAFGGGGKEVKEAKTEHAKLVSITEFVTANGKIQPAVDVKISSEVSGEIIELAVSEGNKVEKGDLLVKINPDIYISALNRAEAAVNSSKAQLANSKARLAQVKAQFTVAERNFKRSEKLHKAGAISDSEFEQSLSNYEVSKAEVEASEQSVKSAMFSVKSASATMKEASDNLKRTTIYAPQGGTVSSLSVEKGERVVGTSQMQGTEMMRISNMSDMEVHVDVNENDIIRVKLGDTALIEVDSYLGKKFKGVVTEIANAAASQGMGTDQVTNFAVKIGMVSNSYDHLMEGKPQGFSPFRPGMSSSVEVITQKIDNAVGVPIEAVTTRTDSTGKAKRVKSIDDEDFECVFVYKGGKVELRKVEVGIQDNKNIQILSGIEEGDEVVTGPYRLVSRELENGESVEIKGGKRTKKEADQKEETTDNNEG